MYIHIHARARKTSKIGCFLPFLTPKSSKHTEVAQNRRILAQMCNYTILRFRAVRELKNSFYDDSAISDALSNFVFFVFFLFEGRTVCTISFRFAPDPVPVYMFARFFVYCGLSLLWLSLHPQKYAFYMFI